MHISKPHWEGDLLVVNAVNPTAGLFSGDAIRCTVTVETGAGLLLTAPSAQRAHRMPEGEALLEQHFRVQDGGWLEVWPELFIPQGGSRCRQRTRIEADAGGELLYFEMLAPGRVASGEVFLFESLDWEMDIFHGGERAAREKFSLSPGDGSLHALRALYPAAYYGSCFAIGRAFFEDETLQETTAALNTPDATLGCSRLSRGGCVVKVLARTGPDLRKALRSARSLFHAAAGRREPAFRRV